MSLTTTETAKLIDSINSRGYSFDLKEIDDYNDDVLIAFAVNDISIIDKLPKSRMTDPVLFAVAENEKFWDILRFVNDEDTAHYRDLAIRAVATNPRNLQFVHERHVDTAFVGNVLALDGSHSITSFFNLHQDVAKEFFGDDGLEALMKADQAARSRVLHDFLTGILSSAPISESFIRDSLVVCPGLISSLKTSGRENLGIEVIKDGGWPEQYASDRPTDLKDAVKRMAKPMSTVAQAWQKAFAKTFGIAEVVKAMKSSRHIELLETMYSRAEILPHLNQRKDFKAKGRWLEEDLGL